MAATEVPSCSVYGTLFVLYVGRLRRIAVVAQRVAYPVRTWAPTSLTKLSRRVILWPQELQVQHTALHVWGVLQKIYSMLVPALWP